MTKDRIIRAQKEIQELMPAREQYVLNTSEFDHVRARLESRNSSPANEEREGENDRPQLRRKAQSSEESMGEEQTPSDDTPKLTRNP